MKENALTISWEIGSEDSGRVVTYRVGDETVGVGDAGFDRLLEIVRMKTGIKVILKITQISSLGGESLVHSFPFRDRFNELNDVIGANNNKLVYEFF